jgi:hypothetical protein
MSNAKSGTFVAALQQAHWEWRKEVEEGLVHVRLPEAGLWERWAAVRYLTDEFTPRLDREVHILTGLADRLPADRSGHVWALGELLQFLCRHLCELGAMAQAGPAFADTVTKLIRALHFWCVEVEAAMACAEAGGLPQETWDAFELLFAGTEGAVPA